MFVVIFWYIFCFRECYLCGLRTFSKYFCVRIVWRVFKFNAVSCCGFIEVGKGAYFGHLKWSLKNYKFARFMNSQFKKKEGKKENLKRIFYAKTFNQFSKKKKTSKSFNLLSQCNVILRKVIFKVFSRLLMTFLKDILIYTRCLLLLFSLNTRWINHR